MGVFCWVCMKPLSLITLQNITNNEWIIIMKYFLLVLIIYTNCSYSQPNDSNFWKLTNGPYGQMITTINPISEDSIIVGTNGSGIFLYNTSTSIWKNIYSDSKFNDIYSSIITPSKDILFSAKDGSNLHSIMIKIDSDLNNWKLIEDFNIGKFANVKDSTQNFIIFITQWNGIFKSTDNGETWHSSYDLNDLNGLGLKDVQYDSTNKRIIIATNGTIEDKALNKTNYLNNGILFSDDYGETYYNVLDGNFDNILINQKGLLLAIQDRVITHRSFNNGSTWEEISYFFTQDVIIQGNKLYAVNDEGLFTSVDYGTTWELVNNTVTDLITISKSTDSTLFMGSTNGFYHFSNVSNEYSDLSNGLYASNIWALFSSNSNKILAGGKNGIIYYTENNGVTWKKAPTLTVYGDYIKDINAFTETSTGRIFVGTDRAFFFYSDDLTADWTRSQNYYFNGNPEIWSMATNSKDEIYVGTSNEGIVIINDNASEFRTTPIVGQYILSLDIDENDEVYAGSLYGTVFFTTENATNWYAKSDGLNRLPVVSVKKANNFYACTIHSVHKYNKLTEYWNNISSGLPSNLFISQMIVLGNTIYITSRGNGVYYTTDEGKNWHSFNNGLKNLDITSIVTDSIGYLYISSQKGIYRTNDKIVSVEEDFTANTPSAFIFNNVYPNPFNLTTNISFSNPKLQNISISIYNVLGEEIKLIANKEFLPGDYNFSWNGKKNSNGIVNSGVYFVKLSTTDIQLIQKILLIK